MRGRGAGEGRVDPAALDGLLRRLKREAGVAQSHTRIALRAATRPGQP